MAGRETKLIQLVRASARRHGFVDASVVVGFSGGRDSTVLLASLRSVVRRLTAVHVDHGGRAESAAEAQRAMTIASELGVPCEVVRLDADRVASHRGVGREEAWRRERYRALAAFDGDVVALGHHALDQAETVLAHLLRGAGLRGVAGMRERSMLSVPWWAVEEFKVQVWRPLLSVQPDVLDDEIDRLGIAPVIDVSNEDRGFRRNAIRHDVLPLLERVQPGAVGALVRFGELAGDDDDVLAKMARVAVAGLVALPVRQVRDFEPALRSRAIHWWLLSSTTIEEVSYERTFAVLDAVLSNRGGARIEIAEGYVVAIDDGVARIVQR